MSSKTGERVNPDKYNNLEEYLIYLKHKFAYETINSKVKAKKIIEIGCGEGYGTNLLSKDNTVTGIDLDREAIQSARAKYTSQVHHSS